MPCGYSDIKIDQLEMNDWSLRNTDQRDFPLTKFYTALPLTESRSGISIPLSAMYADANGVSYFRRLNQCYATWQQEEQLQIFLRNFPVLTSQVSGLLLVQPTGVVTPAALGVAVATMVVSAVLTLSAQESLAIVSQKSEKPAAGVKCDSTAVRNHLNYLKEVILG